MNKESGKLDIESSSMDESIGQVKNKILGKETVRKNKTVKEEFLIDTTEIIENIENVTKKNYFRTLSQTEELGNVLTPQKNEKQKVSSRLGSRSDPGVKHIQLEQLTRIRVVNVKYKMVLDKAVAMIPICTGKKDVAEFINTCEIALKDFAETDKQLLLKIITSKLTENALEVTKYRTLDSWEAIKSILQGAFEHKISERAYQ